ncbi:DUF1810 family protein [Methylobacterium durans]|uniref:Uncharacterized protein n=1 Tax=Methylobacterium durans TaxID=2202825 RepID=A0A2U8WFL9_9HYPH|nr:hypothetical protein DK389_03225 [Methylobacterium durans]
MAASAPLYADRGHGRVCFGVDRGERHDTSTTGCLTDGGSNSTPKVHLIDGRNLLGPRLERCTEAVNRVSGRSAHAIFGSPDDMKFRSSITLFVRAASDASPFETALVRYFGGQEDPRTLEKLQRS